MHFKALSILLALLCFNGFGALAAPTGVYRRSPHPPAPTHYDPTNHRHAAAWTVSGHFKPEHGVSVGEAHAKYREQNEEHKTRLQNWVTGPRPTKPHPPGAFIGEGAQAQVFHVPVPVHGHQAVVKVFHPSHGLLDHHEFHNEIANSMKAGQYLGHGHHAPSNTHYLLQKYMGGPEPANMLPEHRAHAQHEAQQRYATQHGITHLDIHNNANYVYNPDPHVPGGHRAELIDWGNARIHAPPPAPAPKKGWGMWRGW